MIIHVQGLGAITEPFRLDISDTQTTIVRAPSGGGKSTLPLALTCALWAQDVDGSPYPAGAIRDPELGAPVMVEADGQGFYRRLKMDRKSTVRKWRTASGKEVSMGTDSAFDEILPADLHVSSALIVIPMRWIDMLGAPNDGQKLREALDTLLPGPTADQLLLAELPKGAPKTEKEAMVRCAADRKARDQADGSMRTLRGQMDAAKADKALLTESALEALRDQLDAAEVRSQEREELVARRTAWTSDKLQYDLSLAAIGRWEARRDAIKLPDEADPNPDAVEAARVAAEAAQQVVADLDAAWMVQLQAHERKVEQHAADLAKYTDRAKEIAAWQLRAERVIKPSKSKPAASHIATAEQVLAEAIEAEEAAVAAAIESTERHADWTSDLRAHEARQAEIAAWDRQRAAIQEPTDSGCPSVLVGCQRAADARASYDRQIAALPPRPAYLGHTAEEPAIYVPSPSLTEALRAASDRLAALKADAAAWVKYESDQGLLGKCPVALEHPGAEPIAPVRDDDRRAKESVLAVAEIERVNLEALARSWSTYRAALEGLGDPPPRIPDPGDAPEVPLEVVVDARALDRHEEALQRRDRAGELHEAAVEAHAEAVESLAQSEAWLAAIRSAPARALAGKLALLGEGRMMVIDHDGHTSVKIDGRDWRRASTGERIAADAEWRIRLREASGRKVPVFVDDVISATPGTVPGGPGVVWLVRSDEGSMEVSYG